MKTIARLAFASIMAFGFVFTSPSPALSQDEAARQLVKNCGPELATHCSNVTVGGGRKLACLFAYNDKLSGRCELTLYLAAAHLERALSAVRRVAGRCRRDIDAHCSRIVPGQGRIALCLMANRPSLSNQCKVALAGLRHPN